MYGCWASRACCCLAGGGWTSWVPRRRHAVGHIGWRGRHRGSGHRRVPGRPGGYRGDRADRLRYRCSLHVDLHRGTPRCAAPGRGLARVVRRAVRCHRVRSRPRRVCGGGRPGRRRRSSSLRWLGERGAGDRADIGVRVGIGDQAGDCHGRAVACLRRTSIWTGQRTTTCRRSSSNDRRLRHRSPSATCSRTRLAVSARARTSRRMSSVRLRTRRSARCTTGVLRAGGSAGADFIYDNCAYGTLGQVIEDTVGVPFGERFDHAPPTGTSSPTEPESRNASATARPSGGASSTPTSSPHRSLTPNLGLRRRNDSTERRSCR